MSSSSSKNNVSSGISLVGAVFIVFLVLKLCNVIDWSWWWVTAPLWWPITLLFVVAGSIFITVGVFSTLIGKD